MRAAQIVQDIQNTEIVSSPLSIRLVSPRAFGGVIPGPEDMVPELVEFVKDVMLYPPWSMPEGDLKFYKRRFHYVADIYRVYPRWFGIPQRPYDAWWQSEEAAEYLEREFVAHWGYLLEEDPAPAPAPLALVAPVVAPAPIVAQKPTLWDETRMAEAMGLEEAVFVERLESGYWAYKYSQRIETWDESKRPLKVVKYRYSFTEAVRSQNIKNKDKRRKIVEEGE